MSDNKNGKSPQDAKITILEELILALNTALKTLRLYSEAHPSFVEYVNKLKIKFNELFETENSVEIVVQKDKLLFNDEVIGEGSEIVRMFNEMLYHLGVQSVVFRKGVDIEDVKSFLRVIMANPDEVMINGGLSVFLNDIKNSYIEIKERDKVKIVTEEELTGTDASRQTSNLSEEEAINKYSGNDPAYARDISEKVFYVLTESPQRLSKLLTISGQIPAEGQEPKTGGIREQVDKVAKAIEKIAGEVEEKHAEEKSYYLHKLKDMVDYLPGDIKVPLVNQKFMAELETSEVARNMIGQFNTVELVDLFHNKAAAENIPMEQLKGILDKITALNNDKKAEIMDGLEKKQAPKEAKIDRTALMPDRKDEGLDILSLSDIENKVQEMSVYTKEEIEKIEHLTSICSKDDMMFSATNVLLEVLPLINEINIYLRFVNMLQDFLEVYLSKNRFDMALKILKVFKDEFELKREGGLEYAEKLDAAIKEAGSESKIYNLIMIISEEDRNSRNFGLVNGYMELLGEEAVNVLLAILGKEEKRMTRKLIVQILIELGQQHIDTLAKRLSDERWYLVRNIVSIFGEIRDEKAIEYIKGILHHPDARVRNEAIRSLGLIGTQKAATLLLVAINDHDRALRQKAIVWLGEIGGPMAVPQLARILEKKNFFGGSYSLKEEAITALEKINSPEALAVLKKATQKKWFHFGVKDKKILVLAEKSIERLTNKSKR
jgi:HEAT repeat protein